MNEQRVREPPTLSPRDEKIMNALLTSPSIEAAARNAHISKVTIYKRLNDPAFIAEYKARSENITRSVLTAIKANMITASDYIDSVIRSPETSVSEKLAAVSIVMKNGTQLVNNAMKYETIEAAEDYEDDGLIEALKESLVNDPIVPDDPNNWK